MAPNKNNNTYENTEACLNLANRLIRLSGLSFPQITSMKDMTSDFFVKLFEKICNMPVPDLLAVDDAQEDKECEAHNVQAVIDTLSIDLLDISLAHIAGEDVIAGNAESVGNLLEVLESCLLLGADSGVSQARLSRTPEPSSSKDKLVKSKVCKLCAYDPELDSNYEEREIESGVCPVCHFSSLSEKDSSISREETDSIQDKKVSSSDVPDIIVSNVDHPEQSEPDKVGVVASSETRSSVSDEVKTFLAGLFKENAEKLLLSSTSSESCMQDSIKPTESSSIDTVDTVQLQEKYAKRKTLSRSSGEIEQNAREKSERSWMKQKKSRSFDALYRPKISSTSYDSTDQMISDKTETTLSSSGSTTKSSTDSYATKEDKEAPTTFNIKLNINRKTPQKFPVHADENDIAVLYEKNMVKRIASFLDETHHRQKAAQIKRVYLQSLKSYKRKIGSPYTKSRPLQQSLKKNASFVTPKKIHKRLLSKSSSQERVQTPLPGEKGLIKDLMAEFPGIMISPSTIRQMSNKYERHLITMRKKLKDSLSKKSQTRVQTEEALKRQKILSDIFNKDIQTSQRMNELEEYKSLQRKAKASMRDARMESARLRHYYDEYYEEMKRKLRKKTYGEEQIFKNLFDDALHMQKDEVIDMKKRLRETQEKDAKNHQIYLDALENFYQNQFNMLAKSLAVEKHDTEMRTKAQQRAMDAMKREYRARLQAEIRKMQDNILKNSEDIHFREMDAARVRENLQDRFNAFCDSYGN